MNKLGLSLSGGGYRAAAFHLGTLKKLNEMDRLSKVNVLSTISGGSITGAAWCLHKGSYEEFHKYMVNSLQQKNIIYFILSSTTFLLNAVLILVFLVLSVYLLYTSYPWTSFIAIGLLIYILIRFQFKLFPVSKVVERAYDKYFFHKALLKDLQDDKPRLAIGSSNLQTGRPFTFSKKKMSDSWYEFMEPSITFKPDEFPVARAVIASSCVPFAFTPVSIDRKYYTIDSDYTRIDPQLVDGGVYDNQGIQKITQKGSSYECETIITSDAGGKLSFKKVYSNTIVLLIRTVDLFMNRIKTSQMVDRIYRNVGDENRPIAYFSLDWKIKECIPRFIDNMIKGQVLKSVCVANNIQAPWIDNPKYFRNEIQTHLENRVGYASIKARNLKDHELEIAKNTGTNLTPLSADQVNYLIIHAENLTELQVKLYLP